MTALWKNRQDVRNARHRLEGFGCNAGEEDMVQILKDIWDHLEESDASAEAAAAVVDVTTHSLNLFMLLRDEYL